MMENEIKYDHTILLKQSLYLYKYSATIATRLYSIARVGRRVANRRRILGHAEKTKQGEKTIGI